MIIIDDCVLAAFKTYLQEREYTPATIKKYLRDVRALICFCGETIRQKTDLIAFKEHLIGRGFAAASINSMLASVNSLLTFCEKPEWKIRYLKIQRMLFLRKERELSQEEYMCMLDAAQKSGDRRLLMLMQTICATGIRVSELRAITVESLKSGCAQIKSKGKLRQILIPEKLCRMLKTYCRERGIYTGMVFITRSGRALDRSNLWKMIKRLAGKAGVEKIKAFPHNLRHLFARTYYEKYRDIVYLADILGHSSINTTRIYTMKNPAEQVKQISRLSLLLRGGHTT